MICEAKESVLLLMCEDHAASPRVAKGTLVQYLDHAGLGALVKGSEAPASGPWAWTTAVSTDGPRTDGHHGSRSYLLLSVPPLILPTHSAVWWTQHGH